MWWLFLAHFWLFSSRVSNFEAAMAMANIKIITPKANLGCPNRWNTLYELIIRDNNGKGLSMMTKTWKSGRFFHEFHGFEIVFSEPIIFESFLTTLMASVVFIGGWGSRKKWLELKIERPQANLACLNQWNTLYHDCKRFRYEFLCRNFCKHSNPIIPTERPSH